MAKQTNCSVLAENQNHNQINAQKSITRSAAFKRIGITAYESKSGCCVVCGKEKTLFSPLTKYGFCDKCNTAVRDSIKTRLQTINSTVAEVNAIGFENVSAKKISTACSLIADLETVRPYVPFFQSSLQQQSAVLNGGTQSKHFAPPPAPADFSDDIPYISPEVPQDHTVPLSTGGFVLAFFLLSIPIVNIIIAIIWACGKCKNINQRNFARAVLIMAAVYILIAAIFWGTIIGAAVAIASTADGPSLTGQIVDDSNASSKSNETIGQQNAREKAEDYLLIMAFSRDGLINQLEFEGFERIDALYAVDNCGADWNEQAAKKAKAYLDIMPYSRSGLIEQLEFDGFTHEQAVYGVEAIGY